MCGPLDVSQQPWQLRLRAQIVGGGREGGAESAVQVDAPLVPRAQKMETAEGNDKIIIMTSMLLPVKSKYQILQHF